MKKTKRFISLLLVIQMIIVCSLIPGVAALDTTETTQIVIETTEELLPMAARGCENDYHHIFDNPEHNLSGFLASYDGNQAAAYGAVLNAGQAYVTLHAIQGLINASNQITIYVNGYNITFRGNVINGILHLGTFFIQN